MTEKLFYQDAYQINFDSTIQEKTEINGQPAILLDSTCFYPTGGGQPHDTGKINDATVLDVIAREQDVLHVVDKLPAENQIKGQVNWTRRFDHMRQHSGQHILSRAFIEVAQAETIGFHLSENSVTIDLDRAEIPLTDLDAVENLCNQIIAENRAVKAWFPEPEELAELNLRKISEKVTGAVRVVDIGGFDICACGGTHVEQTGEIGMIKVVKLEKNKKNLRVEFRCGNRALEDYRQKNALLLQLASDLTVGYWEVGDALERLRTDNKNLMRDLKSAKTRLLQYEAESIWNAAKGEKRTIITAVFEDKEASDLQGMMGYFTQQSNTIALLALAGEKSHVVFGASEDAGVDVVPLFKGTLEKLGSTRGGGRPTLAQGGGFPATLEQLEKVLAEAKTGLG